MPTRGASTPVVEWSGNQGIPWIGVARHTSYYFLEVVTKCSALSTSIHCGLPVSIRKFAMGCSFCLPKDETTKRRESVAGSFADTLPPEGAELEEEPEEVVLVPGSKGRGRRRRRHRRNNNGRGRDRDAPPPEPERGPGSNVATAKPSVWGNAERTAALTQHDDVQRRHQNAQSQHEHKAQPPQQRTRSSLPTAQGPPTCAAFFFPDKGLPCLRWLAGTRCRFGSRCKYLHEPTSLTAVCSFIGDARQSLDVCVYIISCNSVRTVPFCTCDLEGGGGVVQS